MRVLFVSNGYAEDLIAAEIIRHLPAAEIAAYPLVGTGAYPPDVRLLDPRLALPSAGFAFRAGLRGLGADLRAGVIGLWVAQRATLAGWRGRADLVVAVGDTYCLWMASTAAPRVAFVSTADSVRIAPFGVLARVGLRRFAARVFARDHETAAALRQLGVSAECLGNVMMDLVRPRGATFPVPPDAPVVALLPGSRHDAPDNAMVLAQAAAAVAAEVPDVRFLLVLAPTVPEAAVRARLPQAPAIHVTTAFADAVERAALVMGFAGTAHEQAAGLGRPVVACPSRGPQFSPAFLAAQARLLGDALIATRTWRDAAAAAVRLLREPGERERRGAAGRAIMGPPGAAARIAAALMALGETAGARWGARTP